MRSRFLKHFLTKPVVPWWCWAHRRGRCTEGGLLHLWEWLCPTHPSREPPMPAMPTTSRKMHSYKSHHACRDDGGCQQFFAWALLPQPSCLPWWLSACNEQLSCRKAVGCHFSVSFWSLTLHKWMQGPTWGAKPPMNSLGKEGHCHWARGLNFSGDEPPHQPTNLENLISKKGFNFFAHDLKGSVLLEPRPVWIGLRIKE